MLAMPASDNMPAIKPSTEFVRSEFYKKNLLDTMFF